MSYHTKYIAAHDEALRNLEITTLNGERIDTGEGFDRLVALSRAVGERGNQQFLVGNGASAAFSNHMALDWTKNGGVPTQSFANAALLTAMGNDLGFDDAFSAPLGWYGRAGDLLVTISSSGNSTNIVYAIGRAREIGMGVVTLSGLRPDNTSRSLGDINLYIPAKTYGIVECAHQVLLHLWLDQSMGIEERARDSVQNMRADEFQL